MERYAIREHVEDSDKFLVHVIFGEKEVSFECAGYAEACKLELALNKQFALGGITDVFNC